MGPYGACPFKDHIDTVNTAEWQHLTAPTKRGTE